MKLKCGPRWKQKIAKNQRFTKGKESETVGTYVWVCDVHCTLFGHVQNRVSYFI